MERDLEHEGQCSSILINIIVMRQESPSLNLVAFELRRSLACEVVTSIASVRIASNLVNTIGKGILVLVDCRLLGVRCIMNNELSLECTLTHLLRE